jgi:hypothetical protein
MPKYVTPMCYRNAGEGMIDTTPAAITDFTLANIIEDAEAAIDAYFGFWPGFGGFEPHVVLNYEQGFDFEARRARIPLWPAPARNLKRFNIHISNAGTAPNAAASAVVNPGDIVLNNVEGYFEAIPLTAITYSLAAVVWGLGLQPPIAEIDYESGYYIPYQGDLLYNLSNDNKTFQALRGFWVISYTLATAQQPYIQPPIPPNVYVNGVLQSPSLYTVNFTEGQVVFNSALPVGAEVTADYTATIPDLILSATIKQTTYLLQQRALNQKGLGGLESARSGNRQIRRAKTDDVEEDGLCAKARLKLVQFRNIPAA